MKPGYSLFIFALLYLQIATGQQFADSKYYLIDSLELNTLSQNDSLLLEKQLKIFHAANDDSTRLECLSGIVEGMLNPVWEDYNHLHYQMARNRLKNTDNLSAQMISFYRTQLGAAVNNKGYSANQEGNTWKAISYFNESLKLFRAAGDSNNVARVYIGLSAAYHNVGEIELSNQMDQEALEIAQKGNDLEVLCIGHKNLAMKLMMNSYLDEALENALLSVKYSELMPDNKVMQGKALLGLAQVYSNAGDDSLAAHYFIEALEVNKVYSEKATYLGVLVAYGEACKNRLYNLRNNDQEYDWLIDSTQHVFQEVLTLSEDPRFILTKIRAHKNLGDLYYGLRKFNKALVHADQAYYLSLEVDNLPKLESATWIRYRVLKELGRYKEAIKMLEENKDISEQMDNSASIQIVNQNKMKLEYTIQATKDSMQFAATHSLAQKEIENKNDRIEANNRQKGILGIGLVLIAIFSFILFRKFKESQKQKALIEDQKHLVEEKNQEIMDSINYAKRIQAAILPPAKIVDKYLKDCMVIYQPKDVVAGDFYWLQHTDTEVLFAAADCTGHGVPGAMVSVVCNNALNRSVKEFGLTEPGKVLDKTREIVIDEFSKSEQDVKDGMDIALVALSNDKKTVKYAGANNPLWVVRAGEIIEVKADKQPIGNFDHQSTFTTHEVTLNSGDSVFVFSDGIVDQFGGEKGKKFKARRLRELLLSIENLPLAEQKTKIIAELNQWRGSYEQVDDICLIGVKV